MAELKVRFEILTPREREVMAFVVSGRLNNRRRKVRASKRRRTIDTSDRIGKWMPLFIVEHRQVPPRDFLQN
jgi:hypothetical protein